MGTVLSCCFNPTVSGDRIGNVLSCCKKALSSVFKILVTGDSNVGKTNFLQRYFDDEFDENCVPTTGIDVRHRMIKVKGKKVDLQTWDSNGQEKIRALKEVKYKDAQGVIIMFDMTNQESFARLDHWLNEAGKYANRNVIKILVGNKCDLDEFIDVSVPEVQKYAEQHGMFFLQTSAKSGRNVNKVFELMVDNIHYT